MTPIRRLLLVLLPALLAFTLAACGGDDSGGDSDGGDTASEQSAASGSDGLTVAVRDNEFVSPELTISAGETVTWQWEGNIPHNVIGDDFESETQTEGTFTHTFDTAGDFAYECNIHPGMEGTITVQ